MSVIPIERIAQLVNGSPVLLPSERAFLLPVGWTAVDVPLGVIAGTPGGPGQVRGYTQLVAPSYAGVMQSESTGGSSGGGLLGRNGGAVSLTMNGFDLWALGTLTASDTAYYTFSILTAPVTATGLGTPVTLGSFVTKTTTGGGTGNWVAFPSTGCRFPVSPASGSYVIPAGNVVYWTMSVTAGSPSAFPGFAVLGY
jgi:hypothetical protein